MGTRFASLTHVIFLPIHICVHNNNDNNNFYCSLFIDTSPSN